jgi:hypothetical protein
MEAFIICPKQVIYTPFIEVVVGSETPFKCTSKVCKSLQNIQLIHKYTAII